MNYLASLSSEEKEQLLKLPAYVSLLAANHDGGIDKKEKTEAAKLSHIKTYSCNPMLAAFFWEADKVFEKNIEMLNNELPKEREAREKAIRQVLAKLQLTIAKLDKDYAATLYHGMESFKNHVAHAHDNVLEYFIFPMPIKGITG